MLVRVAAAPLAVRYERQTGPSTHWAKLQAVVSFKALAQRARVRKHPSLQL